MGMQYMLAVGMMLMDKVTNHCGMVDIMLDWLAVLEARAEEAGDYQMMWQDEMRVSGNVRTGVTISQT